jgi:hypothetical protein
VREAERLSLEQIRAFLEASEEVDFEGEKREEIYGRISRTLQVHSYRQQSRGHRGLLRRYVEKLTGLSRAQVTRLIGGYLKSGEVKERSYRRHRFAQRYTRADIELLAAVDEAHETLSGPATKRILEREYHEYGKPEYERAGYDLGSAPVQPAQAATLSRMPAELHQDTSHAGHDWRAAETQPSRATRLSAGRYGASRRSGRRQRCVSHQCRG